MCICAVVLPMCVVIPWCGGVWVIAGMGVSG